MIVRNRQINKVHLKQGVSTVVVPTILAVAQRQLRKTTTDLPPKKVTCPQEGGTAILRRISDCLPTHTRSIVLEDTFSVNFCADSGADRACPEVEVTRLEEPLVCKGADGKPIEVKTVVSLHLRLRTMAGSVRIAKPVECLIIPGDADELLLGNDVLTMLRIYVQRQLDLFVANAIQTEKRNVFDDADEPQIGCSVNLSFELKEALNKLMDTALTRGPRESSAKPPPDHHPLRHLEVTAGKSTTDENTSETWSKPHRCKARRYPPEVRKFLDDFNNELVRLGWVCENTESRWACPVLPVRKSGGGYRRTVDYKPVNIDIEAIVGVMPDLQVDLEEVKGAQGFDLFGFIKGYWQIALGEECQEWLSYMTHRKVYTPRRVPQGCTDAALFFQSTIQKCLEELMHKHLLVWIDDLLLFANDVNTYLVKLERMFKLLDFFGFKISPKKSSLYEHEVGWCGKLINWTGVHHDPARI
ncbi:hypothetical protein PHPALM_31918 [Phytophthora palmivora]|uniref:Reverse transcriptase domain-containing protein n=1 Tax=Phytophthora palmivora TaxID=4796 RepID=A0A2P4X1D5_9STRA|nr:hypothetical protein PHPALM_31918 [Phytophthora palmivora]